MGSIWQDLKLRFQQGNAIIKLIMANVAVYIVLALIYVFIFLVSGDRFAYWSFISEWFYFPSELWKVPLRIWTFFTYMFLHDPENIFHILMNMLILYWFGIRLNDLISNEKIFPIYIWGGLVGALFFTIGYNIFPPFADSEGNLVGASASVMAIVLATATLNPRGVFHVFFIGAVELRYIALVWVIYNLIVIPGDNPGGALAHLGGAFMGWFCIYQLRRGKDLSKPIEKVLSFLPSNRKKTVLKAHKTHKKQPTSTFKSKMKVYKGSQKSDYYGNEYGRSFMQKYKEMSREECLNTILEKIKRTGYDGLSEDEKIFLGRYQ